jgi:hypothetical protein
MTATTPTSERTVSPIVSLRCGRVLDPLGTARCKTYLGRMWMGEDGELMLNTDNGRMAQSAPVTYTEEGFLDAEALKSRYTLRCRSRCGATYTDSLVRLSSLYLKARAERRTVIYLAES